MNSLTSGFATAAIASATLLAAPVASASTLPTGLYGSLANSTPAVMNPVVQDGRAWPGRVAPLQASSFIVGLGESGSVAYRLTEDGYQTGTVTVRVTASGNDWVTTCVTSAPYACDVRMTFGFVDVTVRGDGSPRFVYSSAAPATWDTLRLACWPHGEPPVSCAQRNDWEVQSRLAGTTYYLDRVRWTDLPEGRVGQPYSAPLTNALQNVHATVVSGLPAGLRYDDAQHRVVGTPIAAGARWITLMLRQDEQSLSSRAAWFVVRG